MSSSAPPTPRRWPVLARGTTPVRDGDGPLALLPMALARPHAMQPLTLRDWELLLQQARNADLLGQLQHVLERAGLLDTVPAPARRHLDIAARIAERHGEAIRWELGNLQEVLQPLGLPVILLKGAAYAACGLGAGRGRVCNDIDILVPRGMLPIVERDLIRAGWISTHTTAYDQRYYREWTHELPPMGHKHRATTLDVHHALVPPCSGIRPDLELLFDATRPIGSDWPALRALAPADMVMHAAAHLFFGEFQKGLRDLYDIHRLLDEFAHDDGFLPWLLERAGGMGLRQPVLDALRHAHRVFGQRLPDDIAARARRAVGPAWPVPVRDWLFRRVLRAPHPSLTTWDTRAAGALAYARSHWLRMRLPLLLYHLGHRMLARGR